MDGSVEVGTWELVESPPPPARPLSKIPPLFPKER
jgi:hypothetical protein